MFAKENLTLVSIIFVGPRGYQPFLCFFPSLSSSPSTLLAFQSDLFLPPLSHKTSLMDMVDVDMVDTDMVDTVDIFQK